jgi:hypothetical protein
VGKQRIHEILLVNKRGNKIHFAEQKLVAEKCSNGGFNKIGYYRPRNLKSKYDEHLLNLLFYFKKCYERNLNFALLKI